MNKEKEIMCYHCKKETKCNLVEEKIKEKIEKNVIEYLGKKYICEICNNEVYDKETFDYNISTANDELRKQTELIRIDEIKEILEIYNIGKKPLSLVLGLGEITITRYIEGQNPTKDNSDLLKEIKKNPYLYELFLNANKDKITEIAYKKSLGKTKQLELNKKNSKLYDTALYIAETNEEVTPLWLQKVLYFSQLLCSKTINKKIYYDDSEAWKYGPVYREIYESFSYYKDGFIKRDELIKDGDYNLTQEEKKYLDAIIKYFGCYSGKILREMTHLTDPWLEAREGLKEDEPSERIISSESMDRYADKICEEFDIKTIDDIKKYSEYLFNKVNN